MREEQTLFAQIFKERQEQVMDNPLIISAIIFIVAVGLGLWSQYCLPRLSDSRNILFILFLFLGIVSAGSCIFNLVYLLFTGQRAHGDVQLFGTIVTLVVLWRPLMYVIGKIDDALQKISE